MKNESKKLVQKKSGFKMPLGMKITLIALLMAIACGAKAFAEHKEGVITDVRKTSGSLVFLRISVDTDGNRMADTIIQFRDPNKDPVARNLEIFLEKGMSITFDDEGYQIDNGMILVGGSNTKTIDGTNMLDFFPNEAARFKFAAEAKRYTQSQAQPQSAEERRIAELEAELQRLKQGR